MPTSFALTDIASGRLFQRTKTQTTGPVFASGTYSGGTPSAIQLQILKVSDNSVVKDWTTASGSIAGGNWSATITGVAQGGSYYVKARPANATGLAQAGSNPFYVGILIVMNGQSNMAGMSTRGLSPPAASAGTTYFDGSAWVPVPAANGVRELLNGVTAPTSIPCAALNGAIPGVPIASLMKGQTAYINLGAQITAAGGDFEFIAFHQGEGDSANGTSQAVYLAAASQFHGDITADFGRTKAQAPLILAGLARVELGASGFGNDVSWDAMERTLIDAATTNASTTYSHSNRDAVMFAGDSVHWDGTSYGRAGKRYARSITTLLGSTSGFPNWHIASAAVVNATTTTVDLAHGLGTDFTPTSGITGFEVSGDNGANWIAPSAAVRTSATRITLTHSSMSTSSSRKLRYQYGINPNVSAPVLDNSSLALPLDNSAGVISPTPLGVVPVPTFRFGGDLAGSGGTQTLTDQSIGPATPGRLIVMGLRASEDNGGFAVRQITVTPNVGTPVVVNAPVERQLAVQLWQALLGSDADTATTVTVSVSFGATGYAGGTTINLWTIPSTDMQSVTPVDHKGVQSASATTLSINNLTTLAGGTVIALMGTPMISFDPARNVTFSGSETMQERYDSTANATASADASTVSAHAANCMVTATSNVVGTPVALVAVSWR